MTADPRLAAIAAQRTSADEERMTATVGSRLLHREALPAREYGGRDPPTRSVPIPQLLGTDLHFCQAKPAPYPGLTRSYLSSDPDTSAAVVPCLP